MLTPSELLALVVALKMAIFACRRHVSSQWIQRSVLDPLGGMSVSICPLFVRSNFRFDYFTSKLEIWGKIALVARFLSIGWNGCVS